MRKTKLFSLVAAALLTATTAWADVNADDYKLTHAFSVEDLGGGNYKKVYFSQGNLQYQGSTGSWRFAAHQYDYIGNNAGNTAPSAAQTAWIDLFGWATSGNSASNATGYQPYYTVTNEAHYGPSISSGEWTAANSDWGVVNAASLGSGWRTLTKDEWVYLFNTRTTSGTVNSTSNARYTVAKIRTDGSGTPGLTYKIRGIILFPDDFDGSETYSGVTWGTINGTSEWVTTCTTAGWAALEDAGCVFLPAAGNRYGTNVYSNSIGGIYWSSTAQSTTRAYALYFEYLDEGYISLQYYNYRDYGYSVRLVSETAPALPMEETPLTFEAMVAGATVTYTLNDTKPIRYSTDGTTWTDYDGAITLADVGDKVSFRGNNSSYDSYDAKFKCSADCYIYGNIMSLVNAENYATATLHTEGDAFSMMFYRNTHIKNHSSKDLVLPATTLKSYCYNDMFRGCTGLTRAPELPATTLADGCYDSMFCGCTGLTSAPELPATTLADDCYNGMFYGCTGLTSVPENLLPATTLAGSCYSSMFYGCTGLTSVPANLLPATTLANYCYYCMFYGCTGLTTAPALPATTLATYCYYYMFRNCTNLTSAPVLPATNLMDYCYTRMFEGCTNLSSVTCYATSTATNATEDWLSGVAAIGTFYAPKNSVFASEERGPNAIPVGWTFTPFQSSLTTAPTAITGLEYTGAAQALLNNDGVAEGGTLNYSLDNSTWSEEIPTATNAGDYTVYYKVVGDASHTDFTPDDNAIVVTISAPPTMEETPLTFEAMVAGAVVTYTKPSTKPIQYSTDGINWSDYSDPITLAAVGDKVSFRGNKSSYSGARFECTKDCYIYGNIMSLVDATNYATATELTGLSTFYELFKNNTHIINHPTKDLVLPATTLAWFCYQSMFDGCTGLTSAPALPATTLDYGCYLAMFSGCTGLTSAPELPATILPSGCYSAMFKNCTGLMSAPELPATTLANQCYENMFNGCTGLTSAPELPATTLKTYCYSEMFSGCTGLTSAPALPATTLAGGCYWQMFKNCAGLMSAPELPATNLMDYCYTRMFEGCTNLSSVTCYATSTATNATEDWLNGVAAIGTFYAPKNSVFASEERGPNAIPVGWTFSPFQASLTNAPTAIDGLEYTGAAQALLNNDGVAEGGTLNYSLNNTDWSGAIPTATNAGDYTVYYKVVGDASHADFIPDDNAIVVTISAPPTMEETPLTFEAMEAGATVTYTLNDTKPIQYSTDGTTWTDYDGAITLAAVGDKVSFRGNNDNYNSNSAKFNCSQNCYIYGNIMSLVDATNYATATTLSSDHAFYHMFAGNTRIKNHPSKDLVLPATTLSDYCYEGMFQGCTGLTSVPEDLLPATTLATRCYLSMFYNCSNLTNVPALPATTIAERCYAAMFQNCTNLTSAPALHATTLAGNCYESMFQGCNHLTSLPANMLPATTLENNCYKTMFKSCTGLTSAPALPATTLANNCYSNMFQGCTGLTSAPELPATTMISNCYAHMFENCTGLTDAPVLSATNLATNCYIAMFQGCTHLTSAPVLPATTLANCCYQNMFYGCTGLTSAPELPATTLVSNCYYQMFYGCTGLTSAPELPATNLVNICYYQMFYGCSNLSSVTCLATSRSNTNATTEWLSGVAESGTFYGPKNSILASVERGVSTIPTGWNVTTIFIGSGTEADPYIISSTEEWNYLAEKVAAGTDYSGKFFRQTADISVTTMVGTSSSKFSGTYDGDGHTLTVSYTNNSANATAPFRFIDGATIKNLHTAGTITTNKQFASGLAADVYNNSTILNCRSSVYITSNVSGDGTHGGLIGRTQGGASPIVTTIIEGCVFDGKLLGTSTNSCGGLCGWCAGDYGCRLTIRNSLYIPAQRTISTSSSRTLSRASSLSDVTVTNSYYSETFGGAQGKKACSITGASGATVANSGTATVYNVSGITAYGTGIKYNDVLYGGNGDAISLTLSGSTNYKASAGTLTGSSNPRTLTMTTANTVIYGAASVTDAPIANSLTYNGAEQALVNAGTASGGTMYYSLDNSSWSTTIPTQTNADDYTVYYKVVGDATHADYTPSPNTVAVTINKADAVITNVPAAIEGLVYTGSAQTLISAGSATGGELQYSLDNSNWSTNLPTGTDASDYTVYYRVVGDANHTDIDAASFNVTIAAPQTVIGDPNNADQITAFLNYYDGQNVAALTIKRPVLNNMYNTLCLPFDMDEDQIAASSLNGIEIYELEDVSVVNDELYLYTGAQKHAIVAGRPYLVKFSDALQLDQLTFANVVVNNANLTEEAVTIKGVTFTGTFQPVVLGAQTELNFNGGHLFLMANNTLMWPNTNNPLKPFRAYFTVNVDAGQAAGMPMRRGMPAHIGQPAQMPTGVDNVQGDKVQSTKVMIDGVLYIIRGEHMYDAQGQVVK